MYTGGVDAIAMGGGPFGPSRILKKLNRSAMSL